MIAPDPLPEPAIARLPRGVVVLAFRPAYTTHDGGTWHVYYRQYGIPQATTLYTGSAYDAAARRYGECAGIAAG